MRVLFLTPWYPDDRNLQGIFIRDQAVAIAAIHQVLLISSKVDKESFGLYSFSTTKSEFSGVHEHRLLIKRSIPFYNQFNYFIITAWYTWKIAKKFKPEIIHGNIGYPGAFWSWIASKLFMVPYVMTEHSTRFILHLRSAIHRLLAVSFMKRASVIIAVSANSSQDIYSHVKKRPVVIPNLIEVDKFKNIPPVPDESVCQIGFLGGLDYPRKGLDIFLDAMSPIQKNFFLHIGGEGRLLEGYMAQAKNLGLEDRCKFYGFIPDGKVPEFMSRLHFFVSASRTEGFGMVIAEAIACGRPVIATTSGGPEDFVTPSTGVLVPVEDTGKLRDAISTMIDSYKTYDQAAMKLYISDRFSPSVIAASIDKVYRLALDHFSDQAQ